MRFFCSFPGLRRFKSGFAVVAVALILMVPLAACGGSSSPSSTTSAGPVTLNYWAWIPGMDKQVALFNQAHPNIKVNVVNVGAGPLEYNKLYTAIKAKNTPDVAEVEFQLFPPFETTGRLLDIAPYRPPSAKTNLPPCLCPQLTNQPPSSPAPPHRTSISLP